MDTNFTLSMGTRICFDVMIIDDTEFGTNAYYFIVIIQNGTRNEQFYDRICIWISENDCEC